MDVRVSSIGIGRVPSIDCGSGGLKFRARSRSRNDCRRSPWLSCIPCSRPANRINYLFKIVALFLILKIKETFWSSNKKKNWYTRKWTLTAGCNLMILIRCLVCRRLILRIYSSPWWCLFADLTNRLFIISCLRAINSWSIDFVRKYLLCLPFPLTFGTENNFFFLFVFFQRPHETIVRSPCKKSNLPSILSCHPQAVCDTDLDLSRMSVHCWCLRQSALAIVD